MEAVNADISNMLRNKANWVLDATGGHTCAVSLFRRGNCDEIMGSAIVSYNEEEPCPYPTGHHPDYVGTAIIIAGAVSGSLEVWFDRADRRSKTLVYSCSIAVGEAVADYRAKTRLEQRLCLDKLTKVYNPAFLDEKLPEILGVSASDANKIGVIYLDVDNFKDINDTLGHPVGDEVLTKIARIFTTRVRQGSDYVIRKGGDEFIIVQLDTTSRIQGKVVDRIRADVKQLSDSYKAARPMFPTFGLSVGRLITGRAGHPAEQLTKLVDRADELMYQDKRSKTRGGRYRTVPYQPGQIFVADDASL